MLEALKDFLDKLEKHEQTKHSLTKELNNSINSSKCHIHIDKNGTELRTKIEGSPIVELIVLSATIDTIKKKSGISDEMYELIKECFKTETMEEK